MIPASTVYRDDEVATQESEKAVDDSSPERDEVAIRGAPLEDHQKSRWERSWPTIACGAGLFSDGYLNGQNSINHNGIPCDWPLTIIHSVVGQVNTILQTLYKK